MTKILEIFEINFKSFLLSLKNLIILYKTTRALLAVSVDNKVKNASVNKISIFAHSWRLLRKF